MSTIVLRSVKGSALTSAEGDSNFSNLNTDKLENITSESIGNLSDVDLTGNANDYILVYNSGTSKFIVEAKPSGGIASVSADTNPSLGGNLSGGGYTISNVNFSQYKETIYTGGSTSGTLTPDYANGNIQEIALTGNITMNAFSNAAAGQTITFIIKQPAGATYTLTSTMKFAGGENALTATNDAIDILTVFYDGSNYYASLNKNFS